MVETQIQHSHLEKTVADSQRLLVELYEGLQKGDGGQLKKLSEKWRPYQVRIECSLAKKVEHGFSEEQTSFYYGGYITALLQLNEAFARDLWEESQIAAMHHRKYFTEIMQQLLWKPYMRHGELAKAIGVAPNNLSRIMNGIEACPVKLINREENSKYVIYSLTSSGKRYAGKLQRKPERLSHEEFVFMKITRKKLGRIQNSFILQADGLSAHSKKVSNKIGGDYRAAASIKEENAYEGIKEFYCGSRR